MPLTPNWLERLIFLTLNLGPGPTLDMWGGQVFTYQDISGWLNEAGFTNLRRKNIPKGGSALISGQAG